MDNDDHIEEHIFHIPNNDELDLVLYIDRRNNNEHLLIKHFSLKSIDKNDFHTSIKMSC